MRKPALIMILTFIVACNVAHAGSIWAKRNQKITNIYADDVARHIGDVLTISINEDSAVDNKAARSLSKDTSREINFNGELGNFADLGDFRTSAESSNALNGRADFKDERSFEDSITVVIVDVLPNGNLVVRGSRTREIVDDTQVIEVSGIVRPSDIEFDNVVQSERVANFHLVTRTSGISESYTKPGWFGRILDIIWPF